MGIDLLERASKLVIKPLDERHNAARNLEDLALLDDGRLLIVLPLFGALYNDNLVALLENLEKFAELLIGTREMSVKATLIVDKKTHSFHCSWCMWLAVPEVRSKRVEIRVKRTRTRW